MNNYFPPLLLHCWTLSQRSLRLCFSNVFLSASFQIVCIALSSVNFHFVISDLLLSPFTEFFSIIPFNPVSSIFFILKVLTEVDYTCKNFQSHLYQVLFYFSHFLHIMLIFSFINIFVKYLLLGCTRSQFWHSGSLLSTVAYGTFRRSMEDLFFFFPQLWHVGSSSLTRDGTLAPCTGSMES